MSLRSLRASRPTASNPAVLAFFVLLLGQLLNACGALHESADLPGAHDSQKTAPSVMESSAGSPGIGGTGEVAGADVLL